MAWCLIGAKPLFEPTLGYCRASVSCRRPTHPSARYRSASAGILPLIIFFDWPLTGDLLCDNFGLFRATIGTLFAIVWAIFQVQTVRPRRDTLHEIVPLLSGVWTRSQYNSLVGIYAERTAIMYWFVRSGRRCAYARLDCALFTNAVARESRSIIIGATRELRPRGHELLS